MKDQKYEMARYFLEEANWDVDLAYTYYKEELEW